MNDLILFGYRRAITLTDVWRLNEQDKTGQVYRKFEKHAKHAICDFPLRFGFRRCRQQVDSSTPATTGRSSYNGNSVQVFTISSNEKLGLRNCDKNLPKFGGRIVFVLFRTFWPQLLVYAFFRLAAVLIQFANTVLLRNFIGHMESGGSNRGFGAGCFFALGFFVVQAGHSMLNNQYEIGMSVLTMRVRSALLMTIYKKAFNLSSKGRRDFAGEIVNMTAADTERIVDYIPTLNQAWAVCIQILVGLYMLYTEIGIAFVGAFIVVLMITPLNAFVTTRMKRIQSAVMHLKDERLKTLSEVLAGVKVLKLYAWTRCFEQRIHHMREQENRYLRKRLNYMTYTVFSYSLIPFSVKNLIS